MSPSVVSWKPTIGSLTSVATDSGTPSAPTVSYTPMNLILTPACRGIVLMSSPRRPTASPAFSTSQPRTRSADQPLGRATIRGPVAYTSM